MVVALKGLCPNASKLQMKGSCIFSGIAAAHSLRNGMRGTCVALESLFSHLVCAVMFFIMTLFPGCVVSPWESLEYAAVGSPSSHVEAQEALSSSSPENKFESFRSDGLICSVMLLGSGSFEDMHGPYTVSLSISEVDGEVRGHKDRVVTVKSVAVKMYTNTLWRNEGFSLKLDCRRNRNNCLVASGYKDMLLPDFLNPKDGRIVGVEVVIENLCGEDRVFAFHFRPEVKRGVIQLLD